MKISNVEKFRDILRQIELLESEVMMADPDYVRYKALFGEDAVEASEFDKSKFSVDPPTYINKEGETTTPKDKSPHMGKVYK